jgi:WD40 repeat protein
MAMRKPLLATASHDNTVRIFDAVRQVSFTSFQAASPVTAVAMHPWGTEMVISTRQCAHSYIIANELLSGQQLASSEGGYSQSVYSPPGGLLACSQKNLIHIFSTSEYTPVAMLRGHPNDVVSLNWSADGIRLVSACRETVYIWSMESFSKVEEDTERMHVNSSIAVDATCARVLVADAQSGVRLFATSRATEEVVKESTYHGSEPSSSGLQPDSHLSSTLKGEVPSLRLLTRCASATFKEDKKPFLQSSNACKPDGSMVQERVTTALL